MPDLQAFQRELSAWLDENCPRSIRKAHHTPSDTVYAGRNRSFPSADAELWFQRMLERRWIAPDWPEAYGGGGLSKEEAKLLQREMNRLNCPRPVFDLGLTMFGPVIMEFGSEQQKQQHVTAIARGDIRWCQGYSEPGAGSDLASLKCKAEDMGDHFLVNGTKIWTTNADLSDWMFCLVRSDPNAPKHQGISVLLIDMASEGISTSPIELISGESEFCQTFLDNVRVPKENLLGELNAGWPIAKRVLQYEREFMSSSEYFNERGPNIVDMARKYSGVDASGKLRDAKLRDEISSHLMNAQADMLSGLRMFLAAKAGAPDPNLPMTMKYCSTRQTQIKDELLLAILGNRGLSWHDDEFNEDEQEIAQSWAIDKAYTIAGGSSEIQLNIIAKRALGLPER